VVCAAEEADQTFFCGNWILLATGILPIAGN
jgi:hypothetical protein